MGGRQPALAECSRAQAGTLPSGTVPSAPEARLPRRRRDGLCRVAALGVQLHTLHVLSLQVAWLLLAAEAAAAAAADVLLPLGSLGNSSSGPLGQMMVSALVV